MHFKFITSVLSISPSGSHRPIDSVSVIYFKFINIDYLRILLYLQENKPPTFSIHRIVYFSKTFFAVSISHSESFWNDEDTLNIGNDDDETALQKYMKATTKRVIMKLTVTTP